MAFKTTILSIFQKKDSFLPRSLVISALSCLNWGFKVSCKTKTSSVIVSKMSTQWDEELIVSDFLIITTAFLQHFKVREFPKNSLFYSILFRTAIMTLVANWLIPPQWKSQDSINKRWSPGGSWLMNNSETQVFINKSSFYPKWPHLHHLVQPPLSQDVICLFWERCPTRSASSVTKQVVSKPPRRQREQRSINLMDK